MIPEPSGHWLIAHSAGVWKVSIVAQEDTGMHAVRLVLGALVLAIRNGRLKPSASRREEMEHYGVWDLDPPGMHAIYGEALAIWDDQPVRFVGFIAFDGDHPDGLQPVAVLSDERGSQNWIELATPTDAYDATLAERGTSRAELAEPAAALWAFARRIALDNGQCPQSGAVILTRRAP